MVAANRTARSYEIMRSRSCACRKLIGLAALAAGFVLAVWLVTRFASMADYSSEIASLRARLRQERAETSRLEMELTNAQDLSRVMAEASGKLQMGIPTEEQLRKVKVSVPSAAERGTKTGADRVRTALRTVLDWLQ